MIPFRISTASEANPHLKEAADAGVSNLTWLERYGGEYLKEGSLLLFGGTSITDFRLRVAQSHARSDMTPSLWSHVAIVTGRRGGAWALSEVSLDPPRGFGNVPGNNASQKSALAYYDSATLWPNVAILSFPVDGDAVLEGIHRLSRDRGIADLSGLIVPWLAYVWGAGSAANPLLQDQGIPCAVHAETVMGLAGLELTPGLASQSSCPEAIWQSAKWWHRFYAETGGGAQHPKGMYLLRQPSAAVTT